MRTVSDDPDPRLLTLQHSAYNSRRVSECTIEPAGSPLTEAEEAFNQSQETVLFASMMRTLGSSVAVDGPHLAGTTTTETFSKATLVATLLGLVALAGGRVHHACRSRGQR